MRFFHTEIIISRGFLTPFPLATSRGRSKVSMMIYANNNAGYFSLLYTATHVPFYRLL